ncbi:MAG: acyl-CoA dehydrogenase family protein [Frankiaceae bacterium]
MNPNGGAIAFGHPLGASRGAAHHDPVITTLAYYMVDDGYRSRPQTMCGRGGTANATFLELLQLGQGGRMSQVSEREARGVAEAARESEWRLPSFGRQLFLGELRLDLIYPQPTPPPGMAEKGERFLDALQTFLENKVDPVRIERDGKIPKDVIGGLKDLGALGIKIPEEYGGLGLSQVYYNKALALCGTWHAAVATLLSVHQSVGLSQPLRLFGSEEQRRAWLPKLARTHLSAFLLTEPDAGSDPARVATTAVPTPDGGYVLNGSKLWATNGTIADVAVVVAVVPKTTGHPGGITAFIVSSDSPGIRVQHRNEFMGLRGIENSLTTFTDVHIPAGNVIGREGLGLKIALTTLNTGRLSLPAMCAAASKYAVKIAREWAGERVQWGQPIGRHDAIAQKLAFITGTAFALEAVIDVSGRLADDKRSDIRIEAALAKLYGSEMSWRVIDELLQIRGGRGYETAESLKRRGEPPIPVEQMFRDLRIQRVFEGSTEIMHLFIAREAVDSHLRIAGGLLEPGVALSDKAKVAAKAGRFYAPWFAGLTVGKGLIPTAYAEFGPLAKQLRFIERSSRKLARATFYGMSRWQAKLEKKQSFLARIVDIGAELFAMAAAVIHAKTLSSEDPERGPQAFALAELFCIQARRRVDRLFGDLWANDDATNYAAAQELLAGRYTFLERDVADPAAVGS